MSAGAAPTVSPFLGSAILPLSRSVELGTSATVFASLVNGTTASLDSCLVALPDGAPAGLTLHYQTTDPATNLPTGTPDTPVSIPGNNGVQSFILTFTGMTGEPFDVTTLAPSFLCGSGDSAVAAPVFPGISTLDLAMSTTPVPDIVAAIAEPGETGVVSIPFNGVGAFAVMGINLGVTAPITVSVDTSSLRFPVVATICQTASDTGQCMAPPAATVSVGFGGETIQTFSVFLQATGGSELSLLTDRIFVDFTDSQGMVRGATSVGVGSGPQE
jgi:hypothetical protein